MVRVKKILIIAVTVFAILLLVLWFYGTTLEEVDQGDFVAYYNGEKYENVKDWTVIGEPIGEERAWVGYELDYSKAEEDNSKIRTYSSSPENIFISSGNEDWSTYMLFHKTSDPLPAYYSENLSKVVLYGIEDSEDVTLTGPLRDVFHALLLDCKNSPEDLITYPAGNNTAVAGVRLYFGDSYPAYYSVGVLEITETGDYFFVSPTHPKGKPYNNILMVTSEELSNYLRAKIK